MRLRQRTNTEMSSVSHRLALERAYSNKIMSKNVSVSMLVDKLGYVLSERKELKK